MTLRYSRRLQYKLYGMTNHPNCPNLWFKKFFVQDLGATEKREGPLFLAVNRAGDPLTKETMTAKEYRFFIAFSLEVTKQITCIQNKLGYRVVFCRMLLPDDKGKKQWAFGAYLHPNLEPGTSHFVLTTNKVWPPCDPFSGLETIEPFPNSIDLPSGFSPREYLLKKMPTS